MSKACKELIAQLVALEMEILDRENEMSAKEARQFYDLLISHHKNFAKKQNEYFILSGFDDYPLADYMEKKIKRMETWLRRFFEPVDNSTSSTKSDTNSDQSSLDSLLQKQKFYIQMIDSLEPNGELPSNEAELRYEHVSQAYDKFISNQSEIMTFVKGTDFDNQVAVFKDVQRKVLFVQKTLKEIFSPIKPTILPVVKVNEHFNRTERANVIADYLESLYKKRKSITEQIESIESKENFSSVEVETLSNHISQLHKSYVKNQTKIETYIDADALDEELKISREINEKVISLQTKLKEISEPIVSPFLNEFKLTDVSERMSVSDKIAFLNHLLEKQTALRRDVEMELIPLVGNSYSADGAKKAEEWLDLMPKFKLWFTSNQTKIEELITDEYYLHKQKLISRQFETELNKMQTDCQDYLIIAKNMVL